MPTNTPVLPISTDVCCSHASPLVWVIAILSAIAIIGVFYRMKDGFGPNNLRAVGITLVLALTALLAAAYQGSFLTGAIGVFGSIAGYLFADKEPKMNKKTRASLLDIAKGLDEKTQLKIRDLLDE